MVVELWKLEQWRISKGKARKREEKLQTRKIKVKRWGKEKVLIKLETAAKRKLMTLEI